MWITKTSWQLIRCVDLYQSRSARKIGGGGGTLEVNFFLIQLCLLYMECMYQCSKCWKCCQSYGIHFFMKKTFTLFLHEKLVTVLWVLYLLITLRTGILPEFDYLIVAECINELMFRCWVGSRESRYSYWSPSQVWAGDELYTTFNAHVVRDSYGVHSWLRPWRWSSLDFPLGDAAGRDVNVRCVTCPPQ